MMCIVGFSLLYLLSYVCAKTDSIYLLAVCSVVMGFLRMVLMMVNLFTLIKYAFKMEATRNITPGNEPVDGEGWDKLDREKGTSMPTITCFYDTGTDWYIAYRMAGLRIRMAVRVLFHDGLAVAFYFGGIHYDALP